MKGRGLNLVLIVLLIGFCASFVYATSYSATFSQVGNELVVKEIVNGIEKEAYVTNDGLEKSGRNYYFVKKVMFSEDFDSVQIKLNLDTGIIIENQEVYPAGYKMGTDGQIIYILWNKSNVKAGDNFAMFVSLEDTSGNYLWIILIGSLLILLVVGYFIYIKFSKKQKTKIIKVKQKSKVKKEAESVYDYLLDTEKKVIEELKKADRNELWQKQIQNSTGFSKAKVSRLVRNLEARGLIKKIPFGNTNKVRLK
ncbi:MAG: hypothetical protein Q8L27_00325 [archaeon]|nr:hypothetical protein [archaeon]